MEVFIYIIIGVFSFLLGIQVNELLTSMDNEEAKVEILPKCKCDDCTQCDTWCVSKENFSQATCNHPEDAIRMRTVDACVTCEKVEHYCSECGKVICSITDCT